MLPPVVRQSSLYVFYYPPAESLRSHQTCLHFSVLLLSASFDVGIDSLYGRWLSMMIHRQFTMDAHLHHLLAGIGKSCGGIKLIIGHQSYDLPLKP